MRKYRYPLEVHHVITPDGYILGLHRIPHGRYNNTQSGNKPVVFVMHGLLCSSADWVITGPGVALGMYFSGFLLFYSYEEMDSCGGVMVWNSVLASKNLRLVIT